MNNTLVLNSMHTDDTADEAIGSNTPIRIGLILLILASYTGAIWWAAGVQADLNSIKAAQIAAANRVAVLEAIDTRVKMLEMYGSPQVQTLDKRLEKFEKEFELHKATTPGPK